MNGLKKNEIKGKKMTGPRFGHQMNEKEKRERKKKERKRYDCS